MRRMVGVLGLVLLAGTMAVTQQRGPSTPQERAQVLDLAKKLQETPLDTSLQSQRDHMTIVVVEAPDLNPTTCADEMPWIKGKYRYANELNIVHLLSATAYLINNGPKRDEQAAHLAGLEGAIKAYQAMVRQTGKAKWQPMEELVTKYTSGELAKEMGGFCKRS